MKEKKDVYQLVSDRIVEQLAQGIVPWQKPWSGTMDGAISYVTRKPYSLLNQLLLGMDGEFLTYKQVQELGGKVRTGAKARMVVFYKQYTYKEFLKNDDGEKEEVVRTIPVLRYYNVFHISDCEGIESKIVEDTKHSLSPIESAEAIVRAYDERESNLTIKSVKSNKAYYSPSLDEVVVPLMEQFSKIEEYYSTLFHELSHSTGHESRLNRDLGNHFWSEPYAKEELVAEIGAAYLCNIAGVDSDKAFKNSIAYLQGWSSAIKSDPKMIVSACSRAQKAVDYILGE